MRRYLVVANQMLMSAELQAAVPERLGTPPPGLSRGIGQDIPHHLARHTNLPVCHVVAHLTTVEEHR